MLLRLHEEARGEKTLISKLVKLPRRLTDPCLLRKASWPVHSFPSQLLEVLSRTVNSFKGAALKNGSPASSQGAPGKGGRL